jgi:hypothetical protein
VRRLQSSGRVFASMTAVRIQVCIYVTWATKSQVSPLCMCDGITCVKGFLLGGIAWPVPSTTYGGLLLMGYTGSSDSNESMRKEPCILHVCLLPLPPLI